MHREKIKTIMVAFIFVFFLGMVADICAMDAQEKERRDEVAQEVSLAEEQIVEESRRLLGAARVGDVDEVMLALHSGANINAVDKYSNSALSLAAGRGHAVIVGILLKNKVNSNRVNKNGSTALSCAAARGYGEVAHLLLEAKADIKIADSVGDTVLHKAARNGHVGIVELLLDSNMDVNVVDVKGDTPLHEAAYCKDSTVVAMLLKKNAHVNAVNHNNIPPLFYAVWNCCIDTAKVLLDNGANPTAVSNGGNSLLHAAAGSGCREMVEMLLEYNAEIDFLNKMNETALYDAVGKGNAQVVEVLLYYNADINVVGVCRETLLHFAVKGGHTREVKEGHKEIVNMLVCAGLNPYNLDSVGNTVFDRATCEMQQVIMDARLAASKMMQPGMSLRSIPDLSIMVLFAASRQEWYAMVLWLLKLDPQAQIKGGICSICATTFAERVCDEGVSLFRTTLACPHLVCDECAYLRYKAYCALDTERDRGIYVGQNADGVDQWAHPGDINLSRCPECRAEVDGPVFAPQAHQVAQFDALKEEFEEMELARRLSRMLKRTNALRRFMPKAGIVELVDEYAAMF